MGVTLSIQNEKGGVGKTTTTLYLAQGLASKGKSVLVVDLDYQMNLTTNAGLVENLENNVFTVLAGETEDIYDAIQNSSDNFDVLGGTKQMQRWETVSQDRTKFRNSDSTLKRRLKNIKNDYDFILIDNHPDIKSAEINALMAADYVIITTHLDSNSISGVISLIENVQDIVEQEDNEDLRVLGILPTMVNKRNDDFATSEERSRYQDLQEISEEYNVPLFQNMTKRSIRYTEANGKKANVFADPKFPNVKEQMDAIVNEVIERVGV